MKVIFPGPNVGPEAAKGTAHTQLGTILPGEHEIKDEALAAILVDNGFFSLPGGATAPAQPGDFTFSEDMTDKPRSSRNKE